MTSSYVNIERMAGFPAQYSPSRFFSKYSRAYLPPIYAATADNLSLKGKVNFLNMWAWESENLLRELNIEEAVGDTVQYATHSREHSYPGISYRLSDVYRSAFLRTLAWFRIAGDLGEDTFRELSVMTVPVDLSLWDISAQSAPKWWPRFTQNQSAQNGNVESILQASWADIRALVDIRINDEGHCSRRILAAQGPLLSEELREENNVSLNFRLMGFAYKVVGREVPNSQEVARLISTSYRGPKQNSPHSLSVLDALRHDSIANSAYSWKSEDSLEVTALVSRLEPNPVYAWQWFRAYGRPLSLSPFFRLPGSNVVISDSTWSYVSRDRELARFYDWRNGALERESRVMYPRHGNVAEADSDWLSEKVAEQGLKLGYVLQIDLKLQKKSYEEAKDYSHTELIGVSRLICDSTI